MVLANCHHPALAAPLKPGSMGPAIPGWTLIVLGRGRRRPAPASACWAGSRSTSPASPLMTFRDYQQRRPGGRQVQPPTGRWYLTGDSGRSRRRRGLLLLLPRRRRDHHGRLPDRAVRDRVRAGPASGRRRVRRRRRAGRGPRRGHRGPRRAPRRQRRRTRTGHANCSSSSRAGTPPTPTPASCTSTNGCPRPPSGKIQRYLLRHRRRSRSPRDDHRDRVSDGAGARRTTRRRSAWLTLNRPHRRNALDAELIAALDDAGHRRRRGPRRPRSSPSPGRGPASAPARTSTSSSTCTATASTRSVPERRLATASPASPRPPPRGSPSCTGTPSPAGSSWRWPATSWSPPTAR